MKHLPPIRLRHAVLLAAALLAAACVKITHADPSERSTQILTSDALAVTAEYPGMDGTPVQVSFETDSDLPAERPPQVHYHSVFQKVGIKHGITAVVDYEHGFKTDPFVILAYREHLIPKYPDRPFPPDAVSVPLSEVFKIIRSRGLHADNPRLITLAVPEGYSVPQYRFGDFLIDAASGALTTAP